LQFEASLKQIVQETLSQKKKKTTKQGYRVAVEHPSSKCKALSSNSSTTKKKKKHRKMYLLKIVVKESTITIQLSDKIDFNTKISPRQ
jgi:hypothetical protein